MDDMKVEIERFLGKLDIQYPVRSRSEFLDFVQQDIPDICEMENRQLLLRDLIAILRDDDFPINSGHEAAELLAGTCPIRTPNITCTFHAIIAG